MTQNNISNCKGFGGTPDGRPAAETGEPVARPQLSKMEAHGTEDASCLVELFSGLTSNGNQAHQKAEGGDAWRVSEYQHDSMVAASFAE